MCHMQKGKEWAEEIGTMDGEVNFTNHSCVNSTDCGKVIDHKTQSGKMEHIEIICEPHQQFLQ